MEPGKRHIRLRPPSPAMIVACIALFIALGGTSYAATKLSANCVGTKQLKKNAVTNVKVKNATLTAAKIKDGTLTSVDLADGAVSTAKVGEVPGARVRRTAALTLTNDVAATISWDTADINVGGVFNSTQPTRMTAPVAGRYLIIATARWDTDTDGRRAMALEVNGGTVQIARSNVAGYFQRAGGMTTPYYPEQMVEAVYRLNAGDYVEVRALQDSGGDLALLTMVDNGMTFTMEWIAP